MDKRCWKLCRRCHVSSIFRRCSFFASHMGPWGLSARRAPMTLRERRIGGLAIAPECSAGRAAVRRASKSLSRTDRSFLVHRWAAMRIIPATVSTEATYSVVRILNVRDVYMRGAPDLAAEAVARNSRAASAAAIASLAIMKKGMFCIGAM